MPPLRTVLVLGGGSAGFIAALTLKINLPQLGVAVLRSPELGIIGVGESTTPYIPEHLHGYLGLDIAEFYREVQPSWKIGIRFLWGPKRFFNYPFAPQVDRIIPGLSKSAGYFIDDQFEVSEIVTAMMAQDRVFLRQPNGGPHINRNTAYHLENERLVSYLERVAVRHGIDIIDDKVVNVTRGERGIEHLALESGQIISADLFVDASGFRSELLGKALGEPLISYAKSLVNDRAVIGGWDRAPGERILPYTTAETMDAGWCWRIDHPDRINRGYVYCSAFMSDADAEAEFRRKNPRVTDTRVIRFFTGRRERVWVDNVVAVGNSGGFVEPLESTALYVISFTSHVLAQTLRHNDCLPSASNVREFNKIIATTWDAIRRFLAIHFRFNTRLDTPYWRACRADVDVSAAQHIIDYYVENGPQSLFQMTLLEEADPFRLEGYFVLLLGQGVRHNRPHTPSLQESLVWQNSLNLAEAQASQAYTCEEALSIVHSPDWRWNIDVFRQWSQDSARR